MGEKRVLWVHANLEQARPYLNAVAELGESLENKIDVDLVNLATRVPEALNNHRYDVILINPDVAPGQGYKKDSKLNEAVVATGIIDAEKMAYYLLEKCRANNEKTWLILTDFGLPEEQPYFEHSMLEFAYNQYIKMNEVKPEEFAWKVYEQATRYDRAMR